MAVAFTGDWYNKTLSLIQAPIILPHGSDLMVYLELIYIKQKNWSWMFLKKGLHRFQQKMYTSNAVVTEAILATIGYLQ